MLLATSNVLTRFHITKKLNEVRRQETKRLTAQSYEPIFKKSRHCFIRRRSNLTIRQPTKPHDLLKYDLKSKQSKLVSIKKFVSTLRNHEDLLMNYFKAGKLYSSCIVEGLDLRINLYLRKAYHYLSFELLKIFIYQIFGDFPEPKFTHKFV